MSSTLNFLDDSEIAHVGTARTEKEQNTILFKDLNGIIRSYKAGKKVWSKEMYNLALKDKKRCIELIGPEIN